MSQRHATRSPACDGRWRAARWRLMGAVCLALGLASGLGAAEAKAAPPADDTEIVELRLEVEGLAVELQGERAANQRELEALRAERQDLERRLRLARARRDAMQAQREQVASEQRDRSAALAAWRAPVLEALAVVRRYVKSSLPYARASRLERIDSLERELTGGRSDLAAVAESLWDFVQQEAQLAREVGATQQAYRTPAGETRFGVVLHFGLAVAYARSPDGELSIARRSEGDWVFAPLSGRAEALVRELFDAHERHETFGAKRLVLVEASMGGAP